MTTEDFTHLLNTYGEDRAEKALTSWETKTPEDSAQWWYLCLLLWLHRKTWSRSARFGGSCTHAAATAEPLLRAVGRKQDAEFCRFQRFVLVRGAYAAASKYTEEYPHTYAEWCVLDAA